MTFGIHEAPAAVRPRRYALILLALLALWLLAWSVVAWGAIQDDALIHLRYAHNLRLLHLVSYDGIHQNYGASSLLYITLLAWLSGFSASPDLPHALSVIVHLGVFAALAAGFVSAAPRLSALARVLWLLFLLILVAPSSVRWLQDGMETGIVLGAVLLLAALCFFWSRTPPSPARLAALALTGFLLTLLRVELSLLTALAALIFLLRLTPRPFTPRGLFSSLSASISLAIGGALACAVIVLKMHFLLPDTSLAKSHGAHAWPGALHSTAIVLGSGMSFGAGLCLFWLLTVLLLSLRRRLHLATLVANSVFPIVLLLSALHGQEVQGARYLDWTFAFSILWNLLALGAATPASSPLSRTERTLTAGFALLLLLLFPIESVTMAHLLRGRVHTMQDFRAQHLDLLHDHLMVAGDIGLIGYFTGSDICDVYGLVNGRDAARLSTAQRITACIQRRPQLLFLNQGQLYTLAFQMDLRSWQVCDVLDFFNVSSVNRHYLVAAPTLAPLACRASGQAPVPVPGMFPDIPAPASPVH